jgi:RNA polymerase sigma factor (sigma-70 family)
MRKFAMCDQDDVRSNMSTQSYANDLDRRYRTRLCALVAREMNSKYSPKEDPEDVVQSALRTFFRRKSKGEFQVDDPDELWKVLRTITHRKMLKHIEYHRSQKRSIEKETNAPADSLPAQELSADMARLLGDTLEAVLDKQNPLDSKIYRLQLNGWPIGELVDVILGNLEYPYPEILHRRLQGERQVEIADALDLTRSSVKYRLDRIVNRLQKLLADSSSG